MSSYDHPNFLVIHEDKKTGAISCPSAGTAFTGSTLKTYAKALVLGCSFRIGSGGSAAGTNSLSIARIGTGGTASAIQATTIAMSAGASANGDVYDISLTTGFTVHSLGEGAALLGNAASLDKVAVLSELIWRYRFLNADIPPNSHG